MGNGVLLRYKEDWKAQHKRGRGASGGLVRHGRRKKGEEEKGEQAEAQTFNLVRGSREKFKDGDKY